MEDRKIRVGIIGTGVIASAHVKPYLKRKDVEVVALCDIVPGKAEAFNKRYEVNAVCYLDHIEMLEKEDLDAVSVCTYNAQHAIPTINALKRGVNVLCEKPFAVTIDECVAMMRAEKESGKILSIGFQPRFDKNMQQIKKIVQSGELGRIYYIQVGGGRRRGLPRCDSFARKELTGMGASADIGCYAIDTVLNAIGYPTPLTASGYTYDFFGKDPSAYSENTPDPEYLASVFSVDDFAGGLVRLEGDIILDFRTSWAMNINTTGDTLILGTKAGLRIPSTECWNSSIGGEMTIYRHVAGQPVETKVPLLKTDDSDPSLWEMKIGSFIQAVKTGGKAPVPTHEILKNHAIIEGIVRSAECGREVEIVIPEI